MFVFKCNLFYLLNSLYAQKRQIIAKSLFLCEYTRTSYWNTNTSSESTNEKLNNFFRTKKKIKMNKEKRNNKLKSSNKQSNCLIWLCVGINNKNTFNSHKQIELSVQTHAKLTLKFYINCRKLATNKKNQKVQKKKLK